MEQINEGDWVKTTNGLLGLVVSVDRNQYKNFDVCDVKVHRPDGSQLVSVWTDQMLEIPTPEELMLLKLSN